MANLARKTVCGAIALAGMNGCLTSKTTYRMPTIEGIRNDMVAGQTIREDSRLRTNEPAGCKEEGAIAWCNVYTSQPIRVFGMVAEASFDGSKAKLTIKDGSGQKPLWDDGRDSRSFRWEGKQYHVNISGMSSGYSSEFEMVNGRTVKNESASGACIAFMVEREEKSGK